MTRVPLALLVILAPVVAHAAVPGFLPYSGRLTDGTAAGASTTANLRVLLYTCACASDAPDSETCTAATRCAAGSTGLYFEGLHANVPVVDGYFSLMVGMYDAGGVARPDPANSALTPKLPLPDRLWITVRVNDAAEMSPRQAIGSVPYAFNADGARTLGGADSAAIASRYVDAAGDTMSGPLAVPSHGLSVGTNELVVASEGKVGIGTAAPGAKLQVAGSTRIDGALDGMGPMVVAGKAWCAALASIAHANYAMIIDAPGATPCSTACGSTQYKGCLGTIDFNHSQTFADKSGNIYGTGADACANTYPSRDFCCCCQN